MIGSMLKQEQERRQELVLVVVVVVFKENDYFLQRYLRPESALAYINSEVIDI